MESQASREHVWLTVPEAAALMRLGKNRIYELCGSGQLPHRRVGVTIHIRREVAETWTGDEPPTLRAKLRKVR